MTKLSAKAVFTLSGWVVDISVEGDDESAFTPDDARRFASDILVAAAEAALEARDEASLPLPERVLGRVRQASIRLNQFGLAHLLGVDVADVVMALDVLASRGDVHRGTDGLYEVVQREGSE